MGDVTKYPSGTFCWASLATPDLDAARAFYGALFGWEMGDVPVPGGRPYVMCRLEGKDVAGIHEHRGDRPAWTSSVSVDDVESTSTRAAELGADVLREPFDVMEEGREAVLRDPVGSVVSVWQPRSHVGAAVVNEVNTWGWNELSTKEFDRARSFYTELFGWSTEDAPGPLRRAAFTMGTYLIAGIHEAQPGEAEPAWTVAFRVTDADRAVATVTELGGGVLLSPMEIAQGKFAIVSDPSGAVFTVTATPEGALRGVDGS
jgi:predicted enzyme related to lactoylglutathione lyase